MSIESYCALHNIKIVPDEQWPDKQFISGLKSLTAKLNESFPEAHHE